MRKKKKIKLVSRTNELNDLLVKRAGGVFEVSAFKSGMEILSLTSAKSLFNGSST